MPDLVSPERVQNYSADEIADLQRQQARMGDGLGVAHSGIDPPARSTVADRASFDADLVDKTVDVIGQQFQHMTQAAIRGYAKSLVDTMAGPADDPFDPKYIAKRAAAQAEVEAGLRASGVTLEAAPDPRVEALSRATGISLSVAPHEIQVDWSRRPDIAPEARSEMAQWAAAIGVEPLIAKSLVERMVDLGIENKNWTPTQREQFIQRQQSQLTKMLGSKVAASDAITKARQVLASAGAQSAKEIEATIVIHDAFFIRTLANIADAKATFEATRKRL